MRRIKVLDKGGVVMEESKLDCVEKGREGFFSNKEKYFNLLVKYGTRPDEVIDIEFAFDNIMEEKVLGIINEEEYNKVVDDLISLEDCIKLMGENKNLIKDKGIKKELYIKYGEVYKVTYKDNQVSLEMEIVDMDTSNIKYYCFEEDKVV